MYANENAFDQFITSEAAAQAIDPSLVKAIIGQESGFKPGASRTEPGARTSAGLMQILNTTAAGLGYNGPLGDPKALTGLYDPATNIRYGTMYLASCLDRVGGSIPDAVSMYNGGYRPELGFGAVATKALVVCLARDSKGNCISSRNVAVGEYGNHPYVVSVLTKLAYFRKSPGGGNSTVPPAGGGLVPGMSMTFTPSLLLIVLAAVMLFFLLGSKRGRYA